MNPTRTAAHTTAFKGRSLSSNSRPRRGRFLTMHVHTMYRASTNDYGIKFTNVP